MRIHGESVAVAAKVHTLGGFGPRRPERACPLGRHFLNRPKPPRFVLTHGDEKPRQTLGELLMCNSGASVELPAKGDAVLE